MAAIQAPTAQSFLPNPAIASSLQKKDWKLQDRHNGTPIGGAGENDQ
jgi:hypothetical protein